MEKDSYKFKMLLLFNIKLMSNVFINNYHFDITNTIKFSYFLKEINKHSMFYPLPNLFHYYFLCLYYSSSIL